MNWPRYKENVQIFSFEGFVSVFVIMHQKYCFASDLSSSETPAMFVHSLWTESRKILFYDAKYTSVTHSDITYTECQCSQLSKVE